MIHILVLVPLQEEMKYTYEHFKEIDAECFKDYDDSEKSYVFELELNNRMKVQIQLAVIGDMGNLRTSTRIARILLDTDPAVVYLVGLAGSLDPDNVKLGDVVISNRVKALYPDKVKELDGEIERFVNFSGRSAELNQNIEIPILDEHIIDIDARKKVMENSFFRFRRDKISYNQSEANISSYTFHIQKNGYPALTPVLHGELSGVDTRIENEHPKVIRGDILGSEMVIDSQEFIDFLKHRNTDNSYDYYFQKGELERQKWHKGDIAVVDMESYGFFMTLEQLGLKNCIAFAVRGVSDLAANKKNLDKNTKKLVRELAVKNSIVTVIDMIRFMSPI